MSRSKVLQVRLSPKEFARLEQVAEKLEQPVSALARKVLLQHVILAEYGPTKRRGRPRTRLTIKEMREEVLELTRKLEEFELRDALED